MSAHLTPEHIQRYHQRALSPPELLALTDHIVQCEPCRQQVSNERRLQSSFSSLQSGLRAAVREASVHVVYAQIADYVDDLSSAAEREKVEKHLRACPSCAEDARDLRAFRALMSTYTPKQHAPATSASWWERMLSFWRAPTRLIPLYVVGTAVLAALWMGAASQPPDNVAAPPSRTPPTLTQPPRYGASPGSTMPTETRSTVGFVQVWLILLVGVAVIYFVVVLSRRTMRRKE